MSVYDRAKPFIAALQPYVPGKPVEELERELGIEGAAKLASNENALGPSPKAVAAMRAAVERVHRYPDGGSFQLRHKLAGHFDVAPDRFVFGCGSDELLELIAKTFLGPGDELLFAWPSFAMYPVVAQGMGASEVRVPLDSGLVHDLEAMAKAVTPRTRVAIVCNPNNPTGTSFGQADLDRFAGALPDDVLLVVDEVYAEFATRDDFPDSMGLSSRRPGTVVLRSFSKLHGLAGARIGYAVTDAKLAGLLDRARHPFNVNTIAEAGACAAVDDVAHIERTLRGAREGAAFLRRELEALGVATTPTETNFLLARTGAGSYEALLRAGLIVRPMTGFGLPDHVRITIGTREENERLVDAIRRLQTDAGHAPGPAVAAAAEAGR